MNATSFQKINYMLQNPEAGKPQNRILNKRKNYSIAKCREYVAPWGWWEFTYTGSIGSEIVCCLCLVFTLYGCAVFPQFKEVRMNLSPPKNLKLAVIPEDELCGASYVH